MSFFNLFNVFSSFKSVIKKYFNTDFMKLINDISKGENFFKSLTKLFLQSSKGAKESKKIEDRVDARARDNQIRKDNNGSNPRANFFLYLILTGIIICFICLYFFRNSFNSEIAGLLTLLSGVLISCLKEIFLFEFGGGSLDKD